MKDMREADRKKISQIRNIEEIELPMNVTKDDISIYAQEGSDFNDHVEFFKQKIIDVLSTSQTFKQDDFAKTIQIWKAVEK